MSSITLVFFCFRKDHIDLYNGKGGSTSPPAHLKHNQTKGVWQIWPGGVIPYALEDTFDETDRSMIANAMQYIEEVQFKGILTNLSI